MRSEGSMPTLRRRTSSTVRSTVHRSRMKPPGSERPVGSVRSCTSTRSTGLVRVTVTVSTAISTVTPGRGNESSFGTPHISAIRVLMFRDNESVKEADMDDMNHGGESAERESTDD